VALGRLKARLGRLLAGTQMTNPINRRFAKHLRRILSPRSCATPSRALICEGQR
jgi:hypothetical protein